MIVDKFFLTKDLSTSPLPLHFPSTGAPGRLMGDVLEEKLEYMGVVEVVKGFIPSKDCKVEVRGMAKVIGLDRADDILDQCDQWMKSFQSKPDHNPLKLSQDQIFAIGIYTFDLGMNCLDKSENFYWRLNKILRERK